MGERENLMDNEQNLESEDNKKEEDKTIDEKNKIDLIDEITEKINAHDENINVLKKRIDEIEQLIIENSKSKSNETNSENFDSAIGYE